MTSTPLGLTFPSFVIIFGSLSNVRSVLKSETDSLTPSQVIVAKVQPDVTRNLLGSFFIGIIIDVLVYSAAKKKQ